MAIGQDIRITDVPFSSVPDESTTVFINDKGKLRQTDFDTIVEHSKLRTTIIEAHEAAMKDIESQHEQSSDSIKSLSNQLTNSLSVLHNSLKQDLNVTHTQQMSSMHTLIDEGHEKLLKDINTVDDLRDRVSVLDDLDIQISEETTLQNTKYGGYRLLEMLANTIQNGTPSPATPFPLLSTGECVDIISGLYQVNKNGVYATNEDYICNKNPIPCKGGDTIGIVSSQNAWRYVLFYNESGFISSVDLGTTNQSATAPSGATYFNFDVAGTLETVGKIALTINGKYVVPIKTRWKNFANPTRNIFVSRLGGVIASKTGFDYVATASGTAQVVNMYIPIKENTDYAFSFKDKGYINSFGLTFVDSIGAWTNITNKVKSGNSGVHKYALLSWQLDAGYSGTISVYDVQLEVGAETDFEEYRETIAYILTNEPPRKGDFFYKENGLWRLEHNTHETRLLSEWGWSLRTNGTVGSNGVCDFQATSNDKGYASACQSEYTTAEAMCTHYPIASFYQVYANNAPNENSLGVYTDVGGEYAKFRCRHSNCTTLEEFKAWLDENDVRVHYKLATPIIEVLDLESQLALYSLKTFDDVTYIEVLSRVKPQSIISKYGTSTVSALALENTNLQSLINITAVKNVANNLMTTEEGFVLDARQGKVIADGEYAVNFTSNDNYSPSAWVNVTTLLVTDTLKTILNKISGMFNNIRFLRHEVNNKMNKVFGYYTDEDLNYQLDNDFKGYYAGTCTNLPVPGVGGFLEVYDSDDAEKVLQKFITDDGVVYTRQCLDVMNATSFTKWTNGIECVTVPVSGSPTIVRINLPDGYTLDNCIVAACYCVDGDKEYYNVISGTTSDDKRFQGPIWFDKNPSLNQYVFWTTALGVGLTFDCTLKVYLQRVS